MILMKAKRILAAVLALLMLVSFAGCKKSKSKKRGNLVSGKVSQQYSDGEGKTDIYEINSNAELPSAAQQPGVSAANAPAGGASGNGANTSSGNKASANPHYYLGLYRSEWQHWVVVKDATYDSSNKYITGKSVKFDPNENIIGEEYYPYGTYRAEYKYNSDGTIGSAQTMYCSPASYSYKYDSQKRLAKVTEKSGNIITTVTEFTYDDNGRLVFVRERLNDGNLDTEYKYDSKGNLTECISGGSRYVYKYDSSNRLILKQCYDTENGGKLTTETERKYDKNGYVIYYRDMYYSDEGQVTTEEFITNDINGNPDQVKCYSTKSGKKTLDYTSKTVYSYKEKVTATTRFTYAKNEEGNKALQVTEYEYHRKEAFNVSPDTIM